MNAMIKYFSSLLPLLLMVACATKTLSPSSVTSNFWTAQQENKLEEAKKFVRKSDEKNVALQQSIKIKRYTFSKVQEEADSAIVPTKVYIQGLFSKDKKNEVAVDFETKLDKTDDGWKINLPKTKSSLYVEAAKKMTTGLSEELAAEFKKRLGDLNEFKSIFETLINGMQKSLKK